VPIHHGAFEAVVSHGALELRRGSAGIANGQCGKTGEARRVAPDDLREHVVGVDREGHRVLRVEMV
jgi:hypothetical protein